MLEPERRILRDDEITLAGSRPRVPVTLPPRQPCRIELFAVEGGAATSGKTRKVDVVANRSWESAHFAMTNWFYDYQWEEPAAQVRILAEQGYQGVMLSLKDEPRRWQMLPE